MTLKTFALIGSIVSLVLMVGGFGFLAYCKNLVSEKMTSQEAGEMVMKGAFDRGGSISLWFKGKGTGEGLREHVEADLTGYVEFARNQGIPCTYRYSIDTEAVAGAETLCLDVAAEFPRVTFFAGKVIFGKERWYHAILHNGTAYAIQKRLQWAGQMVVVVPVRVT